MSSKNSYIEVAISLPIEGSFTYSVPESLEDIVSIGKRVLVPFRRRRVTGYVLGEAEYNDTYEIYHIIDVLDDSPLFPPSMIPFFKWISDYYIYPMGLVIQSALPRGINLSDTTMIEITDLGRSAISNSDISPMMRDILKRLENMPCQRKNLEKKSAKAPASIINRMEKQGLVTVSKKLKTPSTRIRMDRYAALSPHFFNGNIPVNDLSELEQKIVKLLNSPSSQKWDDGLSLKELNAQVAGASRILKSLEKKGYVSIFRKKVYRDPFGDFIVSDHPLPLTKEQEKVVRQVIDSLDKGFSAFLLAGVTGSGKTEVYMQICAYVIQRGYGVIVLVPEIALISQMERRFRARFGECVAVLHSGLSAGERYDQWIRIISGQAAIVVGARSAVFAPFEKIGLIIVDEEHDASYKQESGLLYNAKDIAVVRAKFQNCIALMGSATPSVQSCYNADAGKFTALYLKERVENRSLPEIEIVDLRKNRDDLKGIRRFITYRLQSAMAETLKRGEQIILFLNHRGFATKPVCAGCGSAMICKNCDITLTLHITENVYKCHYCDYTLPAGSCCPVCGSSGIKLLGFGTEKVAAAVQKLFPHARIARMDRDTTSQKGAILKILKGLRNKTIDILVGTQMVAKGHDFPDITLVGIICADLALNLPDFRAGEQTFQVLAQVAGRSGRGKSPGIVILQTYNPYHFSILCAKNQDYQAFYLKEIEYRKALNYPPFSRIVQLKISGADKNFTNHFANDLGAFCRSLLSGDETFKNSVQILGPIMAAIPRIANRYRWQIIFKAKSARRLHQFIRRLIAENPSMFLHPKVRVITDIDPFSMF